MKVKDISINICKEELELLLVNNSDLRYIHLDHSDVSFDLNIIELSRKESQFKQKLILLTNHGFMLYVLRNGISSLIHFKSIKDLWIPVKENKYEIDENDIVYRYIDSESMNTKKLLVIFSTIGPKPHSSSLSRYFPENFPSIQKYISDDTAILRIADLGGVTGSYYLNTIVLKDNEFNIQNLINKISSERNIKRNDIVFFGISKGGSGALYHGLSLGYKVVAVDPILTDEYYVKCLNDYHCVEGVFPLKLEKKFESLISDHSNRELSEICVIVSERSEQYRFIIRILGPILGKITLLNSLNEKINTHPQVAPNTIHAITMAINSKLIGVGQQLGMFDFI